MGPRVVRLRAQFGLSLSPRSADVRHGPGSCGAPREAAAPPLDLRMTDPEADRTVRVKIGDRATRWVDGRCWDPSLESPVSFQSPHGAP